MYAICVMTGKENAKEMSLARYYAGLTICPQSTPNPCGAGGGSHKKMQTVIYRLCVVSAVVDCDGMKIFALVADPICAQQTQKIDFIK